MSRYFMYNTRLGTFEQIMLLPPNFSPRSSGFQIGDFKYSADDVDCRYCTDYKKKKCKSERCSWLKERIKAEAVTYHDLVIECFAHLKNSRAKARIYLAAADFHGELYQDHRHMERLAWIWRQFAQDVIRKPPIFVAALHLLSADAELWKAVAGAITENDIDFTKVKLRGISTDNYILYQTAKSVYTNEKRITVADLADDSMVNDDLLKVIIGAMLIARFGYAVYSLEH